MDQKEQFDAFLEKYKVWLDDNVRRDLYAERALYMLLKRFKDEMPPIDSQYFHKAFRQTDVCDNNAPEWAGGCIDMAIHSLLSHVTGFWEVRGRFLGEDVE